MTRDEFLGALASSLSSLSEEECAQSVAYYAEIIDDRVESGVDEAEAIAELEEPEAIAARIVAETADGVTAQEPAAPVAEAPVAAVPAEKKKLSALAIVLLILGSPLWASLLVAAAALVFALLVTVWAAVFSLAVVTLAIGFAAVALVASSVFAFATDAASGFMMIGGGAICAGLALLLAPIAVSLAVMTAKGTARVVSRIFSRLMNKNKAGMEK